MELLNKVVMKRLIIVLFITLFCKSYSQSSLDFFPSELNIQPFTANILEPKLGFLTQFDKNDIRLDIGNSMDLIHYSPDSSQVYSFGADLFTYTLLRGENNFHFPVDAVDYLFGVNFGYSKKSGNIKFETRFRISHISAHFVDGHFDGTNNKWRNDHSPRVYSREFFELIPSVKYKDLRVYAGYTYIYHIDPEWIGKNNYQAGIEYFANGIIHNMITPFAAYDIKLIQVGKTTACNSLMIGCKIGISESRGISVYFQHYSGKSIHGEYFDYNKKYNAFGVNLDL